MDLATAAAELNKSAQKYKKTLLMMPSIGVDEVLPFMTGFPGVTYKETIGELFANSQLRPYTGSNNETDTTDMSERDLETFLGSCVELFDPNQLRQTVWAQLKANSDNVKDVDFKKAQMMAIMSSILSKLNSAVWGGVRNASGTTTADLINGFDTISQNEITANKITTGIGNLYNFDAAIDDDNAYDLLRGMYRNAPKELKKKKCFIFCDPAIAESYEEDYGTTMGSVLYNKQFEQPYLQGTGKRWTFAPLAGKAGSGFIQVSTKSNMIYGYGNGVEKENVEVRRGDNAFKLQFVLALFFGVQYATLNPKELLVGKLFQE